MTDPNFDEIPAYIPKKGEEFMSSGQLKHFIHKLNVWREQLVSEAESTIPVSYTHLTLPTILLV